MSNRFDSLIKELQEKMKKLLNNNNNGFGFTNLNSQLIPLKMVKPDELQESIDISISQFGLTESTNTFLQAIKSATVQDFNTATSLVQLYLQTTQALDQILSELFSLLSSNLPTGFDHQLPTIREDIQQILNARKDLQKSLKTALREFGNASDELGLEQLLKNSALILDQLKNSTTLAELTQVIDALIDHLKAAQKLFKTFSQKDEELTGNEPDEVNQLIRNWGDSVAQIEQIERGSRIQSELSDPNNSRPAIARTILVHDLLEINYDYLTSLIRSGDLESAGIL